MSSTDSRSALLVIDMQESALVGCLDGPGVLARINALLPQARQAGMPVVFIQHEEPDDPEMAAGSMGWQLVEGLDRLAGDIVIPKTYRDSFADTDLGARLAEAGITRVVLTGVHSDFCVQTTALSALVVGFDVTLVSDAHTTRPVVLPEATLGAEALVALVNSRVATMRHPGRTVDVLAGADVFR